MNITDDDFEQLGDGKLFNLIAKNNGESEKAFDVFYSRYKNDFYGLLFKISSNESVVKELFCETMEQAYFKADTFKVEENISKKSERGRTLRWLKRVAENIYNQRFRDQKKEIKIVSESGDRDEEKESLIDTASDNGHILKGELTSKIRKIENNILGIKDLEVNSISLEKRILQEVLLELSERDRDILLAYIDEYDPEIKNQKLSRAKIKELSERYGVTPNYIRTIKKRTFTAVSEKCLNKMAEKAESKI